MWGCSSAASRSGGGLGRRPEPAMAGQVPPRNRSVPRRLRLVALVLLGLAAASVLGNRGLVRLYQMHQERTALEREVEQLGAANARLADEIRSLRTERGGVERIAREELGLVKPGELVYEFRPAAPPPR